MSDGHNPLGFTGTPPERDPTEAEKIVAAIDRNTAAINNNTRAIALGAISIGNQGIAGCSNGLLKIIDELGGVKQ